MLKFVSYKLALISAFLCKRNVEQGFDLCLDIEEESFECDCSSESEDKNK